ncbi:MAG: TetR/AcrR family transcriptional regulator, partial [Pseudomonadota bacterium]
NIVKELGFSGEHFPERTAAALLQTLGLKRAEAEKVAARPLPVVETADSTS